MAQQVAGYNFTLPTGIDVMTVEGIVSYSDGRPADNVDVRLVVDGPLNDEAARGAADADITDQLGRFRLHGYKGLIYDIVASEDPDRAFAEDREPVEADQTGIRLTNDVDGIKLVLRLKARRVRSDDSKQKIGQPQ